MRSLALFSPTFNRIQSFLRVMEEVKKTTFLQTRKRVMLEKLSNAFLVANSIERNITDLQCEEVESELAKIQQFLHMRDFSMKGFQLTNNKPISERLISLKMNVRSSIVQKIDDPIIRDSLYFHELKDIQNILEIQYPKNAPKFIRNIYRNNVQNQMLDTKNPLGVPIWAQPFQFMLEFNQKFEIQFYCRYGNINIRTVRLLKYVNQNNLEQKKCFYILSGMNIPRPVQNIVNEYCKKQLCFDEPEFFKLHKLSHIGGRVEQIQFLLNLFEFYSTGLLE